MGEGPECLLVFGKVESILFNFVAAYCLTLNLNNTEHICSDGMCLIRESLLRIFFISLSSAEPQSLLVEISRILSSQLTSPFRGRQAYTGIPPRHELESRIELFILPVLLPIAPDVNYF